MNKVYAVVDDSDYFTTEIIEIYSSLESAENACKRLEKESMCYAEYSVIEYDVLD